MKYQPYIKSLGGAPALAIRLKLGENGRSIVTNWYRRGIPAKIRLAHPKIFSGYAKYQKENGLED
jgi:hypothetical protein